MPIIKLKENLKIIYLREQTLTLREVMKQSLTFLIMFVDENRGV